MLSAIKEFFSTALDMSIAYVHERGRPVILETVRNEHGLTKRFAVLVDDSATAAIVTRALECLACGTILHVGSRFYHSDKFSIPRGRGPDEEISTASRWSPSVQGRDLVEL